MAGGKQRGVTMPLWVYACGLTGIAIGRGIAYVQDPAAFSWSATLLQFLGVVAFLFVAGLLRQWV